MQVAFVTHDVGLYGAARSLHGSITSLIGNGYLGFDDVVLIYDRSLSKKPPPLRESFLFREFEKGIQWVLPVSGLYEGGRVDKLSALKTVIKLGVFALLWHVRYKRRLKKSGVQRIHLNSLTLWPMLLILPRHAKIVMHIREILDERSCPWMSRIAKHLILTRCHRIIAIDKLTAAPFLGTSAQVDILQNPFDMSRARALRRGCMGGICRKYGLDPEKRHIALIGKVYEVKGPKLFLALAGRCRDAEELEFLLVGSPADDCGRAVVAQTAGELNLRYVGEVQDIEEIFAVTDILVRCERFLPLGRTVWEAYYSGAAVVLPARPEDDLTEISDMIDHGLYTYEAGNLDEFERRIRALARGRTAPSEASVSTNGDSFAKRFWELLTGE